MLCMPFAVTVLLIALLANIDREDMAIGESESDLHSAQEIRRAEAGASRNGHILPGALLGASLRCWYLRRGRLTVHSQPAAATLLATRLKIDRPSLYR